MNDSISKVSCVDCKSVITYSFILVAHDGEKTMLMLVASCPECRKSGDDRSLRKFEKLDNAALKYAMEHKLPIVILR